MLWYAMIGPVWCRYKEEALNMAYDTKRNIIYAQVRCETL
jgi:hypothetical protein